MNRDFVEMLAALSNAKAEYLLVGAHALAAHGIVRATGDLDIWVRPTPSNAVRVWVALQEFGAPLDQITEADLAEADVEFQIGLPPTRIDLLTSITGVAFDDAWKQRISIMINDLQVPIIGAEDFISNKRLTGRPRDLADIAELEARKQP